ncbi:iron-siderophore ABC transporter substrate-binding protein [Rhodococcus sp. BP-252]|uniref:Iron ABC transporter substrate-binding protein n=1 Tax=Rhodococcoides kyotonense TaxID=398843 RepID=A0A177Y988_9NOCA|nr:iron-siderophore ABC transporter substrate-binding protein [Rhodococcus sp. BP-320]MBY6418300.1 iron-siderophore ABC transporter substrate-binding protein [Rhodococcus sp. BP-321]MBY6422425.1 iron-siderophore ABC transporter substrate-binding protein [Rhodococcus sp. BP-324]MBY6428245.1 iron-siderophore ABC transporter substrate-binding protein [Rhodococcus sp. BP-323]MBY6433422.1 iron-siderophore ABC transporter substrate-binding protein [Rhodococcus sp. BP-322]MBY6442351.1 iron-siderophor
MTTVMTACSSADAGEAQSGSESSTRVVDHARGTTEVPASPLRVVTLEPVELDTAVALGVIPVGTAVLSETTGVPAYLGAEAADITPIGTVAEPRIESIAALQPDLILGTETRHGEYYEQLSAIAPTVYMASQSDPWQDNVRLVGRTLGREGEAEALLDDYADRCDDIAAKHDTAGKTAQLIRPRNDQLTLYGPLSFAGSTLECAGFTTPPRPEWADEISVDLSPELAAQARADLIVVTATNPADPAAIPAAVTENAAALPNPHAVDQSFWITGVGPKGGQAVLDDIDRILAEQN